MNSELLEFMMKTLLLNLFTLLMISSCISPLDKGKVSVRIHKGDVKKQGQLPSVTNVQLVNDQLIVQGANFLNFISAQINSNNLSVVSNDGSTLVLSAPSVVTLALNSAMNLIINTSFGAATVAVTFNVPDASITSAKIGDGEIDLNHLSTTMAGLAAGKVLSFNGTSWETKTLDGLIYKGSYNATSGADQTTVAPVAGHYYIVQTAGSNNPDSTGGPAFSVGDWAVFDGTNWDRIVGSNSVTSVNGQTGVVTLGWADISKAGSSINDLADVDSTGPIAVGKILKWDGTKWALDDDLSSGGAGSVTSAEINDGSIVDADISGVAAIAQSKISGLVAVVTQVGTNTTNIATNTTNIATITTGVTTNAGNITTNTGNITTNTAAIATNGTNIATNTGNIATNTTAITGKEPALTAGTTGQYYRGDKSWQTLDNSSVGLANVTNDAQLPLANRDDGPLGTSTTNVPTENSVKTYVDSITGAITASQWTTSGSDINFTTGKVGVGIATPKTGLQVTDGFSLSRTIYKDGKLSGWNGTDPIVRVSGLSSQYTGQIYNITVANRGDQISRATFLQDPGGAGPGVLKRMSMEGTHEITAKVETDDTIVEFFTDIPNTTPGDTVVHIEVIVTNDAYTNEAIAINPGVSTLAAPIDHTEFTAGKHYYAGNIGIGKSNPTQILDIESKTNPQIFIKQHASTAGQPSLRLSAAGSNHASYVQLQGSYISSRTNSSQKINFGTSEDTADTKFHFDLATSRMGIGQFPSSSLDVKGTVTATSFVGDGSGLINVTSSQGSSNIVNNIIAADSDNNGTGDILFQTGGSSQVKISNSGDMNIGFPTHSGAGATSFSVGSTTEPSVFSLGEGTNDNGQIKWDNSNDLITIGTTKAGTGYPDSLVIKDGNVGIGKNNPASKLDVNGVIRASSLCDEVGANCQDLSSGITPSLTGLARGTLASPTISFDSDSSTGFYSPGTNQLGISINGASTARLNNAAFSFYRRVVVSNVLDPSFLPAIGTSRLGTINSGTVIGEYYFDYGGRTVGSRANITLVASETFTGTKFGGSMRFSTVENGTNTAQNRLTINHDGNVGIGITNPSEKLEVAGKVKATQLCIGVDCKSSWPAAGTGSITSIVAGDGLIGGTITTTGTIAVDSGTTANKIVKLDSFAKLPAVNGSLLTNLPTSTTNILTGFVNGANTPITNTDTIETAFEKAQGQITAIDSAMSTNSVNISGKEPILTAGTTAQYYRGDKSWQTLDNTAVGLGNVTNDAQLPLANRDNGALSTSTTDVPTSNAVKTYVDAEVAGVNASQWTTTGSDIYYNSGNVGIGITTPQTKFQIHHNNTDTISAISHSSNISGAAPYLALLRTRGSYPSAPGVVNSNDILGVIGFAGWDSLSIPLSSRISSVAEETFSTTTRGSSLRFSTTAVGTNTLSERVRITDNGNVGIGTTSPSYKLHVVGQVAGNAAYVNTSDERYKENIEVIPNALDKILALDGVYFDWRNDEYPDMNFVERRDMGLIAQNIERVFPEAVVEDEEGMKSVAYSKLVAPLVEATKEQQRAIASLESENAEIKSENAEIKSENAEIKSENAEIKSENAEIKSENAEIKSENTVIKAENKAIKKELEEIKLMIKNLSIKK